MAVTDLVSSLVCFSPFTSAKMEDEAGMPLDMADENSVKVVLSYGVMCIEFYGGVDDARALAAALEPRKIDSILILDSEPHEITKKWGDLAHEIFGTPPAVRKARVLVSASVYWFYTNADLHPGIEKAIRKEYPRCYQTAVSQTPNTVCGLYGD